VCVCVFASGSKINFLPELPTADEWTKLSGHYTLDFYLKLEPFSFSTFFYALNFFYIILSMPFIFKFRNYIRVQKF